MADQQLQITITANTQAAIDQLKNVASGLQGVSVSSGQTGNSMASMAAGVFTGQAALQAVEKAASEVVGELEVATAAAMKHQLAEANLTQAVTNMGLSTEVVVPKVQAYAKEQENLGFTNTQTTASMSQLILVTGDYGKAAALNGLAMDLSRARHMDLAAATDIVAKATLGNVRILGDYGAKVTATMTPVQGLIELHNKLADSAKNFANSTEGATDRVKAKFEDLQVQIGDALLPVVDEISQTILDNWPAIEGVVKKITDDITVFKKGMDDAWISAKDGVAIFEAMDKKVGETFGVKNQGLITSFFSNMLSTGQKAIGVLSYGFQQMTDQWGSWTATLASKLGVDLAGGATTASKAIGETATATADLKTKADDAKAKSDAFAQSIEGIGGAAKNAASAAAGLASKVDTLTTKFQDMQAKASDALAKLDTDNQTKMASIRDQMDKTIQSMADLKQSYDRQEQQDTMTVADQIVKTQKDVAAVKVRLSQNISDQERMTLTLQLQADEKDLTDNANFIKSIDADVQVAKAEAAKSDLGRAIDNYNAKRKLAQEEYDDKINKLNAELIKEQEAKASTIKLYNERVSEIQTILSKATSDYNDLMDQHLRKTKSIVAQEIGEFAKLAAAMSQATSGNAGVVSNVGAQLSGTRAAGGPVTSGEMYLVGEKGPEIFAPSQSGNIIPNGAGNGAGGGVTIHVNINGAVYTDAQMATKFANQVAKIINQQLKLKQHV